MNVTLTLEAEVVRKARRVAAARDTTLTGLIRDYLTQLTQDDGTEDLNARNLANLERAFDRFSINVSPRTWKRADVYERR